MSDIISAGALICQAVLIEKNGLQSAMRIMDAIVIGPGMATVQFTVWTTIRSQPTDRAPHVLQVFMRKGSLKGDVVARAEPYQFRYGYGSGVLGNLSGPGGFSLTTNFNVNVVEIGGLGVYYLQVDLDQVYLTCVPLTLRQ